MNAGVIGVNVLAGTVVGGGMSAIEILSPNGVGFSITADPQGRFVFQIPSDPNIETGGQWKITAYSGIKRGIAKVVVPQEENPEGQISPILISLDFIPGDINGDGKNGLLDALITIQLLAGLDLGSTSLNPAADVLKSGRITPADALHNLQYEAGLRE